MSLSMSKAWTIGLGVLVVVHILWLTLFRQGQYSEVLTILLWGSSFLAAALVAILSPTRKFLMGLSMALPAALLALALNFLLQAFGDVVDFPGVRGAATLLAVTLAYNLALCAIGAAVGTALSRKRTSAKSVPPAR